MKQIALFILCFSGLMANGQVKFSASLSPEIIGKDEITTLRYIIENAQDIQSIVPPSLKNFILISGPHQESGMADINGTIKNYLALNFILKGSATGKFNIPSAKAIINGKEYKSNSLVLTVTKNRTNNIPSLPPAAQALSNYSGQRPMSSFNDYIFKTGDDIAEKVSRNMHLKLETNKTSCYVGEPIIASYKLYTRLKSESKLTQNPAFNGFSVIDLQQPDVTATSLQKLNGREYNVYLIRKAQLYPLQPGNILLESAEVENDVQFIREKYALINPDGLSRLFDDFANAIVPAEAVINQRVFLKSKPVSITVKPLPEEGKPVSFKGSVGHYQIHAELDKNLITTDKPGSLIVNITGSGNMQMVTAPSVSWPAGIEQFEIKSYEKINEMTVPVSGTISFEYPFSADKPGSYTIPAIQFSYFDPAKESYNTVSTGPITFNVQQGNKAAAKPAFVNLSGNGIANPFNTKIIIIVLSVIGLAGIVYMYFRKKNTVPAVQAIAVTETIHETSIDEMVTSSMNPLNPLSETENCLYNTDCNQFYTLLNSELKNFLAVRLSIPVAEVNKKRVADIMDKKNVSNETILSLQALMQDIEWQLYTPFERDEKMLELYQRSYEMLQLIKAYDLKSP